MKKKTLTISLSLLLALSINFSGQTASANSKGFKYQLTPENKIEWSKLKTKREMVEASKISSTELNNMSTEDLIKAVLDYPLLDSTIYLFNSYEQGLKVLENESSAFKALLERNDAGEKLLEALNKNLELKQGESLDQLSIAILLSDKTIWGKVSNKLDAQEKMDKYLSSESDASTRVAYTSATVQTPKGSIVPVIIRGEELTLIQKSDLNQSVQQQYPNATYSSTSTTNFNCHSYAWYSNSTGNTYWMNDPSKYMSDGSYSSFSNLINAGINTRVFYNNGDHSGIVYEAAGPIASATSLKIISKWGQGPVMKHTAGYSPYDSSTLTIWKKN
ncbi:hypothetical protein ACTHPH_04580 [Paenibacillus pasadenensis]|uniref:hypothetical protein n=1 Tax=Paenibacillus TaxID=44249 RepID=UPI000FD8039F|nr:MULTISPECIES: hypothetical protein [Paenibacillus]QGG54814.1 hypothetical protein GE073_03910 [Paenibacillus sp. B01]